MKQSRMFRLPAIVLGILFLSAAPAFARNASGIVLTAGIGLDPGQSAAVPVYIRNEENVSHRYTLYADDVSGNCELYFISGGQAIHEITVPPVSDAQADLNILLKNGAAAGDIPLSVRAVREDGIESVMGVTVSVRGDYAVSMSSLTSKAETGSGKSVELAFSVTNRGSKALNGLKIEPDLPYKWIASPDTANTAILKPGETEMLKMSVYVPDSQAAGNFTMGFRAVCGNTASTTVRVPLTVKTGTAVAYWMGGALLLAAGFAGIQLKRHGRR